MGKRWRHIAEYVYYCFMTTITMVMRVLLGSEKSIKYLEVVCEKQEYLRVGVVHSWEQHCLQDTREALRFRTHGISCQRVKSMQHRSRTRWQLNDGV